MNDWKHRIGWVVPQDPVAVRDSFVVYRTAEIARRETGADRLVSVDFVALAVFNNREEETDDAKRTAG